MQSQGDTGCHFQRHVVEVRAKLTGRMCGLSYSLWNTSRLKWKQMVAEGCRMCREHADFTRTPNFHRWWTRVTKSFPSYSCCRHVASRRLSAVPHFIGLFLLAYLLLVIVPLQEPGDGGLRRARNALQEGAVVLCGEHNLVFGHIKLFWQGERKHSSSEKGERLRVEMMSSAF